MASARENSQFVSHCDCPDVPNCEVTLVLDDKSRLSICKYTLINKSEFFKGLFSGNFREKDSSEVTIQEVSHSDMLVFLEYVSGKKTLPLDSDSLCALISLADQFMCLSLQERITKHLGTESMYRNLPVDTKLALLCAADKHKGCLEILETCIRLCANLNFSDLSPLSRTSGPAVVGGVTFRKKKKNKQREARAPQISAGTKEAVYTIVTQAAEYIKWPKNMRRPENRGRKEIVTYENLKRFKIFKIEKKLLKG